MSHDTRFGTVSHGLSADDQGNVVPTESYSTPGPVGLRGAIATDPVTGKVVAFEGGVQATAFKAVTASVNACFARGSDCKFHYDGHKECIGTCTLEACRKVDTRGNVYYSLSGNTTLAYVLIRKLVRNLGAKMKISAEVN